MYSFESRIRYSEVDPTRHLDLSGIIDYYQDCSIFHSDAVGLGFDYIDSVNRVWLVSAWQIIVNRYPALHEKITVGTWPYDFKSMFGYRNFIMKDEAGEIISYANSIWVYFDTLNKLPAKILPENVNGYVSEPSYKMDYAPRKIFVPSDTLIKPAFPVVKANLDNNYHVNNCQYIRMAEEYLPESFIVKQIRADYRKSAILGDIIVPHVAVTAASCTVVLMNEANEVFVTVEFLC